jgi:hypothetical protein
MRYLRQLVLAPLAAVLGACGPSPTAGTPSTSTTEVVESPKPTAPQEPSAGPAGMDDMTWIADNSGGDGKSRLRYGKLGADEHLVSFECSPGGPVEIWPAGKPAEGAAGYPFVLSVDGQSLVFTASVYNGRPEVTIPSNNFSAVRTSGRLAIADEGRPLVEMNAVNDAERSTMDKFFAGCGA